MVMENPNYFSKYGKDFQEKIFQALLNDHEWASQMMEVMLGLLEKMRSF